MPTFSTSFTPPAAVTNLELEVDLPASAMRLSWDPSLLGVDFAGYRVYRSTDGTNFTLLAFIADDADAHYDDFTAPLNSQTTYRVTQANPDFESDPAEASGTLESLAWWVVAPDDESLTFAVEKVRAASLSSSKVQEVYVPIGRSTRIVVGDTLLTEEGSLSFIAMPDNPGMIALLKRIQARMDGTILLKAPDGVNHDVQFGDMSRSYTSIPGLQEITIPFVGAG